MLELSFEPDYIWQSHSEMMRLRVRVIKYPKESSTIDLQAMANVGSPLFFHTAFCVNWTEDTKYRSIPQEVYSQTNFHYVANRNHHTHKSWIEIDVLKLVEPKSGEKSIGTDNQIIAEVFIGWTAPATQHRIIFTTVVRELARKSLPKRIRSISTQWRYLVVYEVYFWSVS